MKSTILDNLHEIRRIDRSNLVSFCSKAHKQFEDAMKLAQDFSIEHFQPESIVIGGMGGSAIGGGLFKDWARDKIKVPIEVCREYSLPAYADNRTLILIVSYSGQTEEALSMFLDGLKRKCMIICVSSGGKLQEVAGRLEIPHLKIPSGIPQPRAALPFLFLPTMIFAEKLGLVSGVYSEIQKAIEILKTVETENSPKEPVERNLPKKLALGIFGTVPVTYGFGIYRSVA